MQKTNVLAAGIVLLIAGCHAPSKSDAYRKVVSVRQQLDKAGERASLYVDGVHRALESARIEHKIVTFECQWTSRYNGDQTTQRTVVLYRDPQTRGSQWWLADDSLRSPLWLPDTSVERQVAFYARRPATVVESRSFGGDSKVVKPEERGGRMMAKSRIAPADAPVRQSKQARKPATPESAKPAARPEPETTIEKIAPVAEGPAKTKPAWRANPTAVPTAKPLLIDEPAPAPKTLEGDALPEPKPLPAKPATNPPSASTPAKQARPNFFQRILSALLGQSKPQSA